MQWQHDGSPLFHGTYEFFPNGYPLKGNREGYEEDWLAHKEAVFACDNLDDIDTCGGATECVSLIKPIGKVSRHDLQWTGKISVLLDEGAAIDSPVVRDLCLKYWGGEATDDPLWEYLCQAAKVITSSTYEDADVLLEYLEDEGPEEDWDPSP